MKTFTNRNKTVDRPSMKKRSPTKNKSTAKKTKERNYFFFFLLAASDFSFRLTEGFLYASLLRTSATIPSREHCFLNLLSALSKDSLSLTRTSAINTTLPSNANKGQEQKP